MMIIELQSCSVELIKDAYEGLYVAEFYLLFLVNMPVRCYG